MEFEINDLASIGVVRDVPAHQLPPEALTLGLNVRYVDESLETLLGWVEVFVPAGIAPHFVMSVVTPTGKFWVYCSLIKAFVYDGTTHSNITRSAGDYTANDTPDWNGTLLGGVPIINNGIDVPQYWSPVVVAQRFQNLTNWPSTLRAKVVRAFGPFLVAVNCTVSGTAFPHLVKWSHPADPGSVPSSWDETDETKDTGQVDLSDVNSGLLVDALPLGDAMYCYKEQSTWKARFVGGRAVFDFGQSAWLTTSGVLGPRCVCTISDGQRQVVATQDDIIWHNGNAVDSILNKKQRRRLFNEIDTANFYRSFIFDNPTYKEVWFCYPGAGATYPDRGLIMNYADPRRWIITEVDGITFRHASSGAMETPSEEDWEANEELWDEDTGPWSELLRRRVLLAATSASELYMLDSGTTRNGVEFTKTLQRVGLGLEGKKRDGSPIVDFSTGKMVSRMWPKLTGNPVTVRFAAQNRVDGSITWGEPATFDPATQRFVDPQPVSGNAVGWEILGAQQFKLDGYKLDIRKLGKFNVL